MNQFPLWFRLSLLHPAASILLLLGGRLLPHAGSIFGGAAYALSLTAFLVNLPGVMISRWLLVFAHYPKIPHYMLLLIIVLLTWGVVVAPFCWIIHRFVTTRPSHE